MTVPMMFLEIKFDGKVIEGEAEYAGFEKQIIVESFSWDANAKHPGKAPTDKARTEFHLGELSISKFYDRASPNLAFHAANRTQISEATLTMVSMLVTPQGTHNRKLLTLKLNKGYIQSLDVRASESSHSIELKEELKLGFRKLTLDYYPAAASNISGARSAAMNFSYTANEYAQE